MVGVTSIVRVRVAVIWVTYSTEVGAIDGDFWAGFPRRGANVQYFIITVAGRLACVEGLHGM